MRPDIRDVIFVMRCCGAATFSFWIASAMGLPFPVWAAISGLIVSQDAFSETRRSVVNRVIGTSLGIIISVGVGLLARFFMASKSIEIAAAVALAAMISRRYPHYKVCMWTCPIVFLLATPDVPLFFVGLFRGLEVVVGAATGAFMHFLSDAVSRKWLGGERLG